MRLIFLITFILIYTKAEINLLCTTKKFANLIPTSDVQFYKSPLKCIEDIENGTTSFAVLSPDEVSLTHNLVSDDVIIFGELKRSDTDYDKSLSTVVISSEKLRFEYLKSEDIKYCHPGFSDEISPSLSNQFIKTIFNYTNDFGEIPKNQSFIEYFYYNLNLTLGSSCLSTFLTGDKNLEDSLKKLYPKLTELCVKYDDYLHPFEQSLSCLTNGYGNVALTSVEMIEKILEDSRFNKKDYLQICKDDTLRYYDEDLCIWKKTSWPVLIGNKQNINNLTEIQEKLKNLSLFTNYTSLSTYLNDKKENSTFNENLKYNKILSWCTLTPEEQQQCELLREVFLIYDIHPTVNCVKMNAKNLDKYECIHNIMEGSTSVTFLNSDQFYVAKRAGLKVPLYVNSSELIKSMLVVNDKVIQNIDDLQNKKGCFSEFGSIDWLSFVAAYKNKILKSSCFYDEELSKFVNESCMPGIRDSYRIAKESINFEQSCKNCEASPISPTAVNCDADKTVNNFATDEGALECLKKNNGDFAVIKRNENFNVTGFKVMCRNGKLVDFDQIEDDCYLSITPLGGIATTKNLESDVRLAFLQLNKLNSEFNLLPNEFYSESFNNLFVDSIKGLLDLKSCNTTEKSRLCGHVLELDKLIEEADTCPKSLKLQRGTFISNGKIVAIVLSVILTIVAVVVLFIYWKKRNQIYKQPEDSFEKPQMELKKALEPEEEKLTDSNEQYSKPNT